MKKKEKIARKYFISFRVSALEKKVIEMAARKVNLSNSNFVRRAALNMKVKLRFSPQELEFYSDLHQYHTHFARISNLISATGVAGKKGLLSEIIIVQRLIKEHLTRFQK